MRNIILFLLHFSIISHLKSVHSINTSISHRRFKKSNCFISNYNLYNSTLFNDLVSNNSNKKKINHLKSEGIVKESESDSRILLESPSSALKSIVDKGSIKSSSIRHEILDKESILDELIVSKDNFKSLVEDLDKKSSDSDQSLSYSTKKLEGVFKVLETSVLKKTVDKKEQVIKPSDKILKRRSKETIYTKLQNYVKSSEPFLAKHNLLEEVKNFVHLLHWNVWHTGSFDGKRAFSWSSNQFERFVNLIDRIDQIIEQELGTYIDTTTNTDQDLMGNVIEERTNFVFSNNYVYNKLREIVELGEFDLYREKMVSLYHIKRKIIGTLKKIGSYLIFDPRETKLYRRTRSNLLILKNYLKNFKYKIYSKLNKTKIFMNKFYIPSVHGKIKNTYQYQNQEPKFFENKDNETNYKDNQMDIDQSNPESLEYTSIKNRDTQQIRESKYDKITIHDFLRYLSHTHISPQNLKDVDNIVRDDLYKSTKIGKWNLYFVGSGSRQPTNTRLTSTMAFKRSNRPGPIWLFDCGEGTKNGLEQLGLDPCQVERIFLTHLHGDHCYGIFSFLYLRERSKNLEIYGPPGTRKLINAIHQNTSTSSFNMFTIHELLPKSKKDKSIKAGSGIGNSVGSSPLNLGGSYTGSSPYTSSVSVDKQGMGISSSNTGVEEIVDIYINNEGYYHVYRDDQIEILAADLEHTMPTVGYVIQNRNAGGQRNVMYNRNEGYNRDSSRDLFGSDSGRYMGEGYNRNNKEHTNIYNDNNHFESIFLRNKENRSTSVDDFKKIVICQDSSDSSKMKKIGMNADVLIHEATLSSTSSLISGILLDIIKDNKDLVLKLGSIRKLYNFLSNIETKLGCFNFTLSALSSFVKCERYYLLQKLNIFKNFINTFKPLDKDLIDDKDNIEGKNKKEIEKKLKEKWLNNVFTFMDRLNALNELNKNEYFIKRLQNRYKLMEKLSKVIPTLDLNKVIDTASRKLVFSRIIKNCGDINYAYEKYDINNKYKDKYIVDVPKYLNSVSEDIFEYWNEILQLELSSKSNSNFEYSIDLNWKLLYDRIIGSFGHSTPNMAGKFASEINAKKLILTHFSNRYPGDEKFENLLTMIRIENEARMGYSKNGSTRFIPVIAAWDKMKVKI